MAHTARAEDDKKEFFDPPDVLEKKIDRLAQMVKDSKHMIVFTGAGISTGAGIPDFRSGMNTSLETGPGVWELRAKKTDRDKKHCVVGSTLVAIPTPTHMMIVKLYEEGVMKRCISQNTDGLHRRSGLPKIGLCELHGNTNLECCKKCGKEYLRDFKVRNAKSASKHLTGRECDDPQCKGALRDSIINFGENLPKNELSNAEQEGEVADLCLAMGSSLTVTPAADIPEEVASRGKQLVIVNLQKTPLDSIASMVIHAKCEDVSEELMKCLGLEIPEFKLKRRVEINCLPDKTNSSSALSVIGKDMDGLPFTFFKKVTVTLGGGSHSLPTPPFVKRVEFSGSTSELKIQIQITTHAYYSEPPLTRDITVKRGKAFQESLLVVYSTAHRAWEVTPTDNEVAGAMATMTIKT